MPMTQSPGRFGLLILLIAAGSAYGAYALLCAPHPKPTPAVKHAAGFVGSAACAECHPRETAQQDASHHAHALHAIDVSADSAQIPGPAWVRDPEVPQAYRVTQRAGKLGVETQTASGTDWEPVHWAFGSSTHAITMVAARSDGRFVEAPLSFYRRAGWDFTPGFLGRRASIRREQPTGHLLSGAEAADCFDCHASGVVRAGERVVLDGMEVGVRCESCHGPGARHVDLARGGSAKEGLVNPEHEGPAITTFCGRCHRVNLPTGRKPTDPVVARFAPVGLQRSPCYIKSNGRLSCISCHNPHGDASQDLAAYDTVCRSCHEARGAKPPLPLCPKRQLGSCTGCHMPKRIIERNAVFTDHWIRATASPTPVHAAL